jgi:hypothetical protein
MLPPAVPHVRAAKALDLNKDFTLMSNDMATNGTCTVLRIWHRQVDRENDCESQEKKRNKNGNLECIDPYSCHDQYIAEFGWTGGPKNGRPDIKGNELTSRKDEGCIGGHPPGSTSCSHYGDWEPGKYGKLEIGKGLQEFTSRTVSQAWEVLRGNSKCGVWDKSSDYNANASQRAGFEEYQPDAILPCRVPAGPVADVPDSYDCPSPNYNKLCARLHNLPQIEIDDAMGNHQLDVVLGSIFLPVGFLLVVGCGGLIYYLCMIHPDAISARAAKAGYVSADGGER